MWVEGEQLPEDYGGCRDNGKTVKPKVYDCVEDAGAELVTFGESKKPTGTTFYAVRGDKIFKIEKEPFTSTTFLVC